MAENSDQVVQFHEYFKVIRNRLWVIFTIFILTVMSGAYVTEEVLPKVYQATTEIKVSQLNKTYVAAMQSGTPLDNIDPTLLQSETEIIDSPDVLMPVVKDLGLDSIWARRLYKSNIEKVPENEALEYMKATVTPVIKRGTNMIDITVSSDLPDEAAKIANAIADRYKTRRDQEAIDKSNSGSAALSQQIADQQKLVDDQRNQVEKLRQEAGEKNVDLQGNTGDVERDEKDLDEAKNTLIQAKTDADARRVLLEKVIALPDDQFVSTLIGLGRSIGEIGPLRSETFRMESDLDNLLKDGFETNHPRVQSLQAEIDRHHKQIAELTAGLRRAMQAEADIANSRIDILQKQVDAMTVRLREDQSNYLSPFRDAKRELEKRENILDLMQMQLKKVKIDESISDSSVTIVSRATPPNFPTKPNRNVNFVISMIAGLFAGIVVAFLIEYLDTSVKTMADAESLLGLPVLTVIPNKGGPMPLTQDASRMPHAEGYRILRAKLDLKVQNGVGPSLSMLSGGPGEGKTTTIYNLAVICAQSGQSVILVDCDLRRPTMHDLFNCPNDRGLANYLRGEGDATEYIQQTALPKLHVLTSGDMPMSEIGVLAGDKIRAMLEDLKQRYDLVLIDAPPVLGISDGSIIAREVDYVILVIQHRRYPREISLRAKRAIEEVHGNCVGMVLNCVAVKSDDSYYYYSTYGNYYKKADRARRRRDGGKSSKGNGKPAEAKASSRGDVDSEEF